MRKLGRNPLVGVLIILPILLSLLSGLRKVRPFVFYLQFPNQCLDNWVKATQKIGSKLWNEWLSLGLCFSPFHWVKTIWNSMCYYIFHFPVSESVLLSHAENDAVPPDNPSWGKVSILRPRPALLCRPLQQHFPCLSRVSANTRHIYPLIADLGCERKMFLVCCVLLVTNICILSSSLLLSHTDIKKQQNTALPQNCLNLKLVLLICVDSRSLWGMWNIWQNFLKEQRATIAWLKPQ